MGTPRREATNGRLAPWTMTEKSDDDEHDLVDPPRLVHVGEDASAASRMGTAPLSPPQAMKSFSPIRRRIGASSGASAKRAGDEGERDREQEPVEPDAVVERAVRRSR